MATTARTDADSGDPGGHPTAPPEGFVAVARQSVKQLLAHDVPVLAAAVAFKIFLSLFPAAAAGVAVFARVGDPSRLLDRARGVLPAEVVTLLEDRVFAVAGAEGTGLLAVVGVLGGLWAASSAAATLVKALNRINGVTETRGFLGQRAVALAITFSLLLALAAILALIVLGPQLRAWLLPEQLLFGAAGPLLQVVQSVGALAILALLLAFVYWIGPDRERSEWLWWSPGALVGVVGWLVVSGGFSLYTQTAANYEATYAGLAGVIVTLLWLHFSMIALLLGAEVNAERVRRCQRLEVLEAAAGAPPVEPTTEPLLPAATRDALPAPATGRAPTPGRAALAATAGVGLGLAAIVASRFRRRG